MIEYCIYGFIDNVDNIFYVGQTINFEARKKQHLLKIKKDYNLPHYKRANKLLENNLNFEIKALHSNISKNQAGVLEQYYVSILNLKQIKKFKSNIKHGKCYSQIYHVWANMKKRCYNKNSEDYYLYGGRGIQVSKDWFKFEKFYLDLGDVPRNKYLERINNNGNYCKENCKWATLSEQSRNTRRNHLVIYKNKTQPLINWAEELNMSYTMLRKRLREGWSIEKVFETPTNDHVHYITYKGVTKRLVDWAKELGINKRTLRDRYLNNWSEEKIFEPIVNHGNQSNHFITYTGITKTIGEWARYLGIKRQTLSSRIFKSKWSIEKAFETPVVKKE